MKKIRALLSRNANYVYHMLSVSKAGYDNNYGRKYRTIHNLEDIKALNKLKDYITVSGGKHIGELYWFISHPASLTDSISLKPYYTALEHLFRTRDFSKSYEKFGEL
jgi:hypothetical protein